MRLLFSRLFEIRGSAGPSYLFSNNWEALGLYSNVTSAAGEKRSHAGVMRVILITHCSPHFIFKAFTFCDLKLGCIMLAARLYKL